MDRAVSFEAFGFQAMCSFGPEQIELLLRAAGDGERGEPALDAGYRQAVYEASLLRCAADDRVAQGVGTRRQPQARGTINGVNGIAGGRPWAAYQQASPGASGVSVLAARSECPGSQRGMVRGHYLRAHAARLFVPGGRDGLVQSLCANVGLDRALEGARPGIFNTDQGTQFTSEEFTGRLHEAGVRISMDGRGRVMDNIFIERLWRSVKYEEIYLRDYTDGIEAHRGLDRYFRFYNTERQHQSLGNRTPADWYYGRN